MPDPLDGTFMCPCADCVDGRARMMPLLFPDYKGENTTEQELAASREALGICSECGHLYIEHEIYDQTFGRRHGDGTHSNSLCGCLNPRKVAMHDVITKAEFIRIMVPVVLGMFIGGLTSLAILVAIELWRGR